MSENSSIEWTDHTFNPVRGCAKVSPGCKNCYAARDALRFPGIRGIWGDNGTRIVAVPDAWKAPVKWNRDAERRRVMELHSVPAGVPHHFKRPRVFCASLADVFEDWQGDLRFPAGLAPEGWVTARWDGAQLIREFEDSANTRGLPHATMDHLRQELFQLIEKTPALDWQILTKRPENIMRMVPGHWRERFPDNVWIGTTVEDQQRADERIPVLLRIPAKVKFLSCEPLLGPVDLAKFHLTKPDGSYAFPCLAKEHRTTWLHLIDWVICGGESGPGARPMHPDWARALRDQCVEHGVPFFFKQWGEWCPAVREHGVDGSVMPDSGIMPCGKAAAWIGHDGKTQYPSFTGLKDPVMAIARMGKSATGRMLDGREYNQMPG